jgi:hypothetical protein
LYAVLAFLTDGHRARILGITLLLCALLVIRRWQTSEAERMAACTLAILLISPVVHPWYLLWLLAFVPLVTAPWLRWTALAWSVTVPLAYLPSHYRLLEYAPVYSLLAFTVITTARQGFRSRTSSPSAEKRQRIPV